MMANHGENRRIGAADMLKLKRWNTPSIYNGWEAITGHDRLDGVFNREETRDFMPSLGVMVGRAVTVRIEPVNPAHPKARPGAWDEWYEYLASIPGPKIVAMRDMGDPPGIGSFWGEVSANTHRSLGCVGAIVDGALRDLDEMTNAGFKALAKRLCVGHLHAWPIDWGMPVEVFGARVEAGMLLHADKHGFIGIPSEDEQALLSAVRAMDDAECATVIPAGRYAWGKELPAILSARHEAGERYRELARKASRGEGER